MTFAIKMMNRPARPKLRLATDLEPIETLVAAQPLRPGDFVRKSEGTAVLTIMGAQTHQAVEGANTGEPVRCVPRVPERFL